MPSLLYYLRRAGEQSFRETLNQARSLVSVRVRTALQPAYDRIFHRELSTEELLRRAGFASAREMTSHLKSRPWPAIPLERGRSETALTVRTAKMPWHSDTKTGYTWDRVHYRRVPLSPAPGVDIKVPWEMSRCHNLVALGLDYRQCGDDRYAREVVAQLTDWIKENPVPYGVNWVSPMEAGIRAVNWCWAFELVRRSEVVRESFVVEFLKSLHTHATFIRSNLEYREAWIGGRRMRLNSNHYLCDLAGLLSIGLLFPELELQEYSEFAARELEIELFEQTTPDGVDYEHSTAYHSFVREIFEYAFSLAARPSVAARLEKMREFIAAFLHSGGSLTQFGDNDSSRLLPAFVTRQVEPAAHSRGFSESGFYSMRGIKSEVMVSAARVGMRGLGSHSNNDLLSFEYWYEGLAWIVDPGTFAYLGNVEARNWFRSTAAHNSVRIDREEQRRFHREAIFQMVDEADVNVLLWDVTDDRDLLSVEHTGYTRLKNPVTHHRRFEFEKKRGTLTILDSFRGSGEHLFEWFFQIHPDVNADRSGNDIVLSRESHRVRLILGIPDCELTFVPGWYSPRYGVRLPATTVVARKTATALASARIVIEPC